jgi:hypothetical protein
MFFRGACDASGGIACGTRWLAVANDEDNTLRYYDLDALDAMPAEEDWSQRLEVEGEPGKNETDIESATPLGDLIFWIGSHSRSKSAKLRPDRHRLFATRWVENGGTGRLQLVGRPYRKLLKALSADAGFARFDLDAASELAPKEPGGLNIESICATDQSALLIGFRNPVPDDKALLAPLLNGAEVIEGDLARFGEPILLELGGLGIRDMARWAGGYLVIGGPIGDPAAGAIESRLFRWDGRSTQAKMLDLPFAGFNPEGLIVVGASRLLVLSDDGASDQAGTTCKSLPPSDPAKRFRALWLS